MSKSEKFLTTISDAGICLNCNQCINSHKSFSFAPPDKFVHLICNPDNSSIQFCRKILGLGQRELADACGIAVVTLADWENGRAPNSVQMKLCQKFLANMLDKKGVESTSLKLVSMRALNVEERNKELVGL